MTRELSLMFAGDICPTRGLDEKLMAAGGEKYLAAVRPLFQRADLVIGNLETPLGTKKEPKIKTGPTFMSPPELATWFKEFGFDGFVMANNHLLDQGVQGLEQTLQALDNAGIPYCGAGMSHEEACQPMVFELEGKSFAIFNFAEGEFAQAEGDAPGAARIDPGWNEDRVRHAKGLYDYVIPVMHIGNEHQPIPSAVTVNMCRRMVEAGADVVIAHHAHIPQGIEVYKGVEIVYSIGNLIFGYEHAGQDEEMESMFERWPGWFLSVIAEVVVGSDSKLSIKLHPFKQLEDLTLAPLSLAGQEAFYTYIRDTSEIMADEAERDRIWEQEARGLFKNFKRMLPEWIGNLDGEDATLAHRAAMILLNLFRCEAHHETMRRGFQLLYEKRFDDDTEAQAEIDRLLNLLRSCHE